MNYTELKSFIRRALNENTQDAQEQYPILFDETAWAKLQSDLDRDFKKAWALSGVTA
jgi:hypothetical protein